MNIFSNKKNEKQIKKRCSEINGIFLFSFFCSVLFIAKADCYNHLYVYFYAAFLIPVGTEVLSTRNVFHFSRYDPFKYQKWTEMKSNVFNVICVWFLTKSKTKYENKKSSEYAMETLWNFSLIYIFSFHFHFDCMNIFFKQTINILLRRHTQWFWLNF